MAGNSNLRKAKQAMNNEFYTQFCDIQKQIHAYLDFDPDVFRDKTILLPCDDPAMSNFTKFFAQNFENFGLKKLISTSYARQAKLEKYGKMSFWANDGPLCSGISDYDPAIENINGKIFTLTRQNKRVDINDLQWSYLNGDGDFRSDEVKSLRDEADFIITNPPFSLFKNFVSWLMEGGCRFLIIGNMNAITYKEIFPLIKSNQLWLGIGFSGGNAFFSIPADAHKDYAAGVYDAETNLVKFRNCCWFTNLEHGRRHQPLQLMSRADNIRFNKKLKGQDYQKYDNYDAIEVPFTDAIPNDYDGVMGVPISFLDKYCPEQFEIIDISSNLANTIIVNGKKGSGRFYVNGTRLYDRIAIRKKQ